MYAEHNYWRIHKLFHKTYEKYAFYRFSDNVIITWPCLIKIRKIIYDF